MGCRKGIYYQTTQVTHWNLLRITTADAIMWCDIFHLFVGRNQNREPVMEGNFRLNVNIEDHIAVLHCLFQYFKNIWPFLRTLISLNKDIFLPSSCRTEENLVLSEKRHLFHWWHSPSCLVKFIWHCYELYFPAIGLWYSSSTIMTYKSTCSLGIQSFQSTIFKIHLHL